jgi:tetratricopeptide (TPR) repeat protein
MRRIIILIYGLTIVGCSKTRETISIEDLRHQISYNLENGDTIKAIQNLEEFNLDNPDNIETAAALIVLKMQSGQADKEESINQLKKLYVKDSTNYWVKQFNSLIKIEEGTDDEALKEIEKMITNDPSDFWNYLEKGRKLIELKKYDEAITAFNKAIELDPLNRYAYADRALAKYLKGDKQGACEDWKIPGGGSMSYYDKYCK